jgi:predicted DsbA family dithiol-disulfide isomerase
VNVKLIPFEFDPPGTYPEGGTDWIEYCQSYGEPKASFLLNDKLPRAFRLGKEIGIDFDIKRRIVHTELVNSALMLVQDEGKNGVEFALQMLHHHFEKLKDPNERDLLTGVLVDSFQVESIKVEKLYQVPARERTKRNQGWTNFARSSLGTTSVPHFIVKCGDSEEHMCKRLSNEGPTSPDYFEKLFQLCHLEDMPDEL